MAVNNIPITYSIFVSSSSSSVYLSSLVHRDDHHQTISFVQLAVSPCNPHTNGPPSTYTYSPFQTIQKQILTNQIAFKALDQWEAREIWYFHTTLMVLPSTSASPATRHLHLLKYFSCFTKSKCFTLSYDEKLFGEATAFSSQEKEKLAVVNPTL